MATLTSFELRECFVDGRGDPIAGGIDAGVDESLEDGSEDDGLFATTVRDEEGRRG
jgi:hypothetical protein